MRVGDERVGVGGGGTCTCFLRMAWRSIAWHGAPLQTRQHDIKRPTRRSGTPLLNPSAPPHLHSDADEVDFDGFLRMLRVGSYDSLDALDQVRPARHYCQGCPAPDGGRPGSKLIFCPPPPPQYDARYGGSLHGRLSTDMEGSR